MENKQKQLRIKMFASSAFILGILLSLYIKTFDPNKAYITLDQKNSMENEIELIKENIENLNEVYESNKELLEKYKTKYHTNSDSLDELLQEQLNDFKIMSSTKAVCGKGVEVTISDSDRELEKDQDPNDLVVHDIDILRLINDLKISGAEVISINSERVTSNSEIKCSGSTITINGTTYGQPFIINAIGEVESLEASIKSPNSYANILKDVYGINVSVEDREMIIIDSFSD